jgi:hypothetical protein
MTVGSTIAIIIILSYAANLDLALASVVNYDRKRRHSLERHLLMTLVVSFTTVMSL